LIWDTATKNPSDHPERLDANPARMSEFRKQLSKAKKIWFDTQYGDEQLNLMILATHPDYRRQGAGMLLVEWGMEEVERRGGAITLFSSPMGFPLYKKLGFHQVGLVHCQVDGEDEFVELPALVWEP
jgi:GNAT superfamily N-acetyltransferase